MASIDRVTSKLAQPSQRWAVTGVAGFIGSHLAEALLRLDQSVIGLDNFETGEQSRISYLQEIAGRGYGEFEFVAGDIRDRRICQQVCDGADHVLHQAALISVAESMSDPRRYHDVNVSGFLNLALAATAAGVKRVVLASTCAVYGDTTPILKNESSPKAPISTYGLTKLLDEEYGLLLSRSFGLNVVALRYFNVYGPGQKPGGAYGAVIPRWMDRILQGKPLPIYGDGSATRDFCHVQDIVQANLLAARTESLGVGPAIFNIGSGQRVSLLELHDALRCAASGLVSSAIAPTPLWQPARPGDIQHIGADISHARDHLGYRPNYSIERGLSELLRWHTDGPQPEIEATELSFAR